MEQKIFEIASKIATPLSLISLLIIVLYLIFKGIFELNIFKVLNESSTFLIITSIIDKLFILSLFGSTLGIISYVYVQKLKINLDSQDNSSKSETKICKKITKENYEDSKQDKTLEELEVYKEKYYEKCQPFESSLKRDYKQEDEYTNFTEYMSLSNEKICENNSKAKNLILLKNQKSSFTIKIWTKQITARNVVIHKKAHGEFRIGDNVKAFFLSSSDAYIYIINIGPTGDITLIFPNDHETDNRVVAGKQYQFPGENSNFDWTLEEPTGTEIIKVIATKQPVNILQFIDEQLGCTEHRNIKVISKEQIIYSPVQWAEASFRLIVHKSH